MLIEDNITKTKMAMKAPKQLCLSGLNLQSIEHKNQIGEKDMSTLSKQRETMIRKSRGDCTLFQKYKTRSKDKPGVQPSVTMQSITR